MLSSSTSTKSTTTKIIIPDFLPEEEQAQLKQLLALCDAELVGKKPHPDLLLKRANVLQKLGNLNDAIKDVRHAASLLDPKDSKGMDAARSQLVSLNESMSKMSLKESPVGLMTCISNVGYCIGERREAFKKLCSYCVSDTAFCQRLEQDGTVEKLLEVVILDTVDAQKLLLPAMNVIVQKLVTFVKPDALKLLLAADKISAWKELMHGDNSSDIIQMISCLFIQSGQESIFELYDFIREAMKVRQKTAVDSALVCLTKALSIEQLLPKLAADQDILILIAKAAHQYECRGPWTMFLARSWECSNQVRELWSPAVSKLFSKLMASDKSIDRVVALDTLAIVFQVGLDFGSKILMSDGVLESIVDCIDMETDAVQVSTLEMLSQACGDKSCRGAIGRACAEYLSEASSHKNSDIRTAAVVVSTKIVSFALQSDHEQSVEMAKQLIASLVANDSKTIASSVEGLAFLVANVEVKIMLTDNEACLKVIYALANHDSNSVVYGVSQLLATLTGFRRRRTAEEEQVQKLRVFAKDALPDTNDKREDDEAVQIRNRAILKTGILAAARVLSKNESVNVQEAAAKIYLNLATDTETRGLMVQGGAVTGLLSITSTNIKTLADYVPFSSSAPLSPVALLAAQALAKLAISLNPAIAFATTATSLVRPLIYLSQSESDLQVFESLLALTNLASAEVSETTNSIHARIVNAKGIRVFQHHQFSDNIMVRRAATEVLCNMMMFEAVAEEYTMNAKKKNGHMKIMMALSDSDDMSTRLAASACLAILCGISVHAQQSPVAEYLVQEERGVEIVAGLVTDDDVNVVLRGIEVLRCILARRELAKIVLKDREDASVMEALQKVLTTCQNPSVLDTAGEIIETISSFKL